MEEALARADIGLSAIQAVAVTHLHNGHAGGSSTSREECPCMPQQAELECGFSGSAEPEPNDIFRIDWRFAEDDA